MKDVFLTRKERERNERDLSILRAANEIRRENPDVTGNRICEYLAAKHTVSAGTIRRVLQRFQFIF